MKPQENKGWPYLLHLPVSNLGPIDRFYASKITLDLVNKSFIKFCGGPSFDASKILQELARAGF